MARIDIVLATYNGAEYLAQQLDSLIAQTHRDWRLIVRDDGSTDRSPAILREYTNRHPERITMLEDDDETLGHVANFSRLLTHSDGDYTAISDQDDVWLPDKLALSLDRLQHAEESAGRETPALVFTDLRVVDADLVTIDESFWAMSHLDPHRAARFNRVVTQNMVTGCTTLLNRALRDVAVPIAPEVVAYDWWLGAVACALGIVEPVERATVLYRQHDRNAVGARSLGVRSLPGLARDHLLNRDGRRRMASAHAAEVEAFLERYGPLLPDDDVAVLRSYLALPDMHLLRRGVTAARNDLLPSGFGRSATFLFVNSRQRAPTERD